MIYEYGEQWWNDTDRENQRETCPSAIFSTTNPTWIGSGANQGLSSERPATNRLNHGTTTGINLTASEGLKYTKL
jgi:hypothetical protein